MKFLLVCLISAVLISQSYSQFVPLIPPAFAPLFTPNLPPFISAFPPLPLRLGPGLPGVPVFPHLGPLPLPGVGPAVAAPAAAAPAAAPASSANHRKSRSALNESSSNQNRSLCSYAPAESLIRCIGGEQIECSVEGRLEEIRNITLRLPVLSMIPETIRTSEGKEAGILRLFSGISGLNSTLVHPNSNRPILLSIYSSPVIVLPGLFVRDARCMNRIESLVSRVGVEGARFSLVVRV